MWKTVVILWIYFGVVIKHMLHIGNRLVVLHNTNRDLDLISGVTIALPAIQFHRVVVAALHDFDVVHHQGNVNLFLRQRAANKRDVEFLPVAN